MAKILYIGNFKFPLGNAAGRRVLSNGYLLKKLGHEVSYIGVDDDEKNDWRNYNGFDFLNIPYPSSQMEWIQYKKKWSYIENIIEKKFEHTVDIIILYGAPAISPFYECVIKYSKKNNVKTIIDVVDWLSYDTKNTVFNIIKTLDNNLQKGYFSLKADGIICISSFLNNYYKNRKKTVVIPPLSIVDKSNSVITNKEEKINQPLELVYAGRPFRENEQIKNVNNLKDRVDLMIETLGELKSMNVSFKFSIYGFTKTEYLIAVPQHRKLVDFISDEVSFWGQYPNDQVVQAIKKADFSFLMRTTSRDTLAGFPTKIVESIELGIPVITTDTSDITQYIKSQHNGFLISENPKKAAQQISVIFNMPYEEIKEMKNKTRRDNTFSYVKFEKVMQNFLEGILE